VAERFSLIGSKPKLLSDNLPALGGDAAAYLRKRIASTIDLRAEMKPPDASASPLTHPAGMGHREPCKKLCRCNERQRRDHNQAYESATEAFIDVEDTGKGIPRKDFKTIFKPGIQPGNGAGALASLFPRGSSKSTIRERYLCFARSPVTEAVCG
jgi:two-component system, sporulation sensor kinase D